MASSLQSIFKPAVPRFREYVGSIMLAALFLLLWCRQYESPDGPASFLYDKAIGGIRWIDLALLSFILFHATLLFYSGRKWFNIPSRISRPSWIFLAVVAFAFGYGWRNGGEHLFFDWRELFLGAALTVVFSYWIRTPSELKMAARIFGVVFGIRILTILLSYIAGGGTDAVLESIRTPLYDGATLSEAGLLGILALSFFLEESSLREKLFWGACSVFAYTLVLSSFRRTFWGELFLSTSIVFLFRSKARLKMTSLVLLPVLLLLFLAGPFVAKRVASFDVTTDTAEYADTNLGHVNDILDAMDHVREHPILGIGLGRPYQTFRIVQWKTESTLVHNALVHVWLFYGLAGLITYLWFHVALLRWLRTFRFNPDPVFRIFAAAVFAYIVAQFVMAAAFSPWPYGQLQNCIVLSFALGSLFAFAPPSFASPEPTRESEVAA